MYSFSTTKVSKNIVLDDLKKVFPYVRNIKSLFPKQEDYDEFITDVAEANAMTYTYSDYHKYGCKKMITETKEDLETLTQKYKKKIKEELMKINNLHEDIMPNILSGVL